MKATWESDDGRVRLYRGDCRRILPALEDASVDMVFTDPPYGHHNNNGDLISRRELALGISRPGVNPARPIPNDGPEANDLFRAVLPQINRLLRHGGCCCCCCGGGGGPDPQFIGIELDRGFFAAARRRLHAALNREEAPVLQPARAAA